jgi:hypothetical protein
MVIFGVFPSMTCSFTPLTDAAGFKMTTWQLVEAARRPVGQSLFLAQHVLAQQDAQFLL